MRLHYSDVHRSVVDIRTEVQLKGCQGRRCGRSYGHADRYITDWNRKKAGRCILDSGDIQKMLKEELNDDGEEVLQISVLSKNKQGREQVGCREKRLRTGIQVENAVEGEKHIINWIKNEKRRAGKEY